MGELYSFTYCSLESDFFVVVLLTVLPEIFINYSVKPGSESIKALLKQHVQGRSQGEVMFLGMN